MGDGTTIRRGTEADAAVIAAFNRAMAEETEEIRLDEAVARRGVEGLFARPERGFYAVAEAEGEVVGSLMVTREWSDWRAGDFWWVQSVYVRPAWRRRGVYRALYAFVRAEAAAAPEVCGVRLYVIDHNETARTTYAALGMEETAYRLYEDLVP